MSGSTRALIQSLRASIRVGTQDAAGRLRVVHEGTSGSGGGSAKDLHAHYEFIEQQACVVGHVGHRGVVDEAAAWRQTHSLLDWSIAHKSG